MKIGQLAKKVGVSSDTVRFYERLGLVQARRRDNGYRDYGDEAAALLQFVKLAQELGFTLAEIRGIAPCWRRAGLPVRGRSPTAHREAETCQAHRG